MSAVLNVTFLDQTGAKSVEAEIEPGVSIARIIPSVVTRLQLPITAPDGTPVAYSLDHKEGGRRLGENESLDGAGVQTGDHLILYPEVVAGGRPELLAGL